MRWLAAIGVGAPLVAVCSVYATQSAAPASSVPAAPSTSLRAGRATLDRYCITCHNQKRPTADLALDILDLNDVAQNARTLEKVAARLRSRTMPPVGLPRPDRSTYDEVAGSIEAALDAHSAAHPDPGRPVIHRLNRAEYANAVRDLLSLDVDIRALLPADDSGYGFDNISDVLSLSPALLERYMSAAGKISRLAVGDAAVRPSVQTYSVPQTLLQRDRMNEAMPFGTRGGASVRHYFPADGEYEIRIRLQRTHASQIRGLGEPNDIELRLDRRRVRQFTVGGDGPRDPWSAVPSASPYEQTADDKLIARLSIAAGAHDLSCRVSRENRAARGRARARAVGRDLRVRGRPRRGDGRRDDRHHRAVRHRWRWRYGEPPPDFRVPAVAGIGRHVRGDDPQDAGAARLSTSGRRRRSRRPAAVLSGRPQHGDVAHGDPQWVA